MNCPNCGSKMRKARAVYEGGTRDSTRRSRGSGIGFSSRGTIGIGFFGSRSTGRSASLAAKKAAPATGFDVEGIFGVFVISLIACFYFGADNPIISAFWWTVGLTIGGFFLSIFLNRDYDNRWYCSTCGELFTT